MVLVAVWYSNFNHVSRYHPTQNYLFFSFSFSLSFSVQVVNGARNFLLRPGILLSLFVCELSPSPRVVELSALFFYLFSVVENVNVQRVTLHGA